MRIVILEDSLDRRAAMDGVLAKQFPGYSVEYYAASRPMIEHLGRTDMTDIALIALDNDLELVDDGTGKLVDPGDGVEVATWLAKQSVAVPVIIHTTNTYAGDKMVELFKENGVRFKRVVPYDGESWIPERWRALVRKLIDSDT